jgi:antitoxin component YwqK of YwqJK toxin-antitoxin module
MKNKSQGWNEEDKIEGIYREFYENGNRKAMLNFTEGVPDGDAEFYYDSGVIKIEGQYKDGLKQGKWKHYTETGELIDKEKWKKDQPR